VADIFNVLRARLREAQRKDVVKLMLLHHLGKGPGDPKAVKALVGEAEDANIERGTAGVLLLTTAVGGLTTWKQVN
jgi:hypothetical protein